MFLRLSCCDDEDGDDDNADIDGDIRDSKQSSK